MENQKLSVTGIIILILASASMVVLPQNFPDLSLVILLYLSLKYESPAMLFWAFLSGLMHDGFNISKLWVSPILFPLLVISTSWAKDNFNLNFTPARLIFDGIFIFTSFCVYLLFWNLTFTEVCIKFLLTLVLAIITAFMA
jgi:cell shape-determining protein MreD